MKSVIRTGFSRLLTQHSKASRVRTAAGGGAEKLDPTQEEFLKERCILLDEDDNVVGEASKETCHLVDPETGLAPLHRAFSVFIFNSENKLLLQQRSDEKITFPGLWTNTCCSHPLATPSEMDLSGEAIGVKRAARRKTLHELGVRDLPLRDVIYLTRILYSSPSCGKWGEHELDYILFLKDSKDRIELDLNPNEVKKVAYVGQGEMPQFLREEKLKGNGVTPWFELISATLLDRWWSNLDNLNDFKEHEKITRF